MTQAGRPFDDIRDLAANLPPADEDAVRSTLERHAAIEAEFGASPDTGNTCAWLSRWSGRPPSARRPTVVIFAGTHGVDSQVAYPAGERDTQGRVDAIADGRSPVHKVCGPLGIGLKVFDLALGFPVGDITLGHALDEKACAATIGFGMEAIAGGVDVLGLAATGCGDRVANAAILASLEGGEAADWISATDPGAGMLGQLAARAAARVSDIRYEPLELLRSLGGREHAAMAGAILAARTGRIPVVLDGLTALTVALLLERMAPGSCAHCRAAGSETRGVAAKVRQAIGLPSLHGITGGFTDGTQAALALSLLSRHADIHEAGLPPAA